MIRLRHFIVPFVLLAGVLDVAGQDGFCMINGTTTGGAGGPVVTVTNGTDFNTQINIAGPRIIQVQGVLSVGRIFTTANKTIVGLGTNATLLGNLNVSDTTNVILQNLRVTGPANDGFTIWNAQHVWIDHCTFYDTGDGLCDMNRGSQYVTVSWCKFHYRDQVEHRFTMIADGFVNGGVTNYGYYTLHHNWWSTRANERMPASSTGRIHLYNNYFNCTNNGYCSDARCDTEFFSEGNYYSGVKNPIYKECTGKIRTNGNLYFGTIGTPPDAGTDVVFTPPYAYTLDPAANVPAIVMAGAGAAGPDTMFIPPKIWDGGGSGNNWNTANNWALDETPKDDDVLVFAGNTRLTPNNNLTANTEFFGITFSNTAGSFNLTGNPIRLGGPITDDSASAQLISLNLDFGFGQFHYAMNREINVSSTGGSLTINGAISGDTNAYFNSYSLAKTGSGLLALNGLNTFRAALFLNGGLLRFNALDTNTPGSLGYGTSLTFDGGGLQWADNNSADISTRAVTLNPGGATLDVGANAVTLASRIGNGGPGGLTKLGAGTLTFNATNNYKGNTLIAQGVLALGAAGLLTNSPQIILSNDATLDVSARTDGTQVLLAGKALLGNGTVRGSVTAANGSTIAPGFSIGTLTITNLLTFQAGSTNIMEMDATAHTNDSIVGMVNVNYDGRLIVTNLSGPPAAGDSFKLFSAGSYTGSFARIVLPPLTGNLLWTNKLGVDGTLAVISPVNTTPTNLLFDVVGGAIQLSWPADHLGWRLQYQSNAMNQGLGTNWLDWPGSADVIQTNVPIDPNAGSVFFRMVYP